MILKIISMAQRNITKQELGRSIDDLRDRLLKVSNCSPLGEQDVSQEFRELTAYFLESKCSQLADQNAYYSGDKADWKIGRGDYLVGIADALSKVRTYKSVVLKQGKRLVDITGEVFDQSADSSFFASFILPGFAEPRFVKTGEDLVEAADLVKDTRGDIRGEVFFPQLYRGIIRGGFQTMDGLLRYGDLLQRAEKSLKR